MQNFLERYNASWNLVVVRQTFWYNSSVVKTSKQLGVRPGLLGLIFYPIFKMGREFRIHRQYAEWVTCCVVDSLVQVWRTFIHGCLHSRLLDNGATVSIFWKWHWKTTRRVPLYIRKDARSWNLVNICRKWCLTQNLKNQKL